MIDRGRSRVDCGRSVVGIVIRVWRPDNGSDGWWITTNQLSGRKSSRNPALTYEVGRARVGEDAVAVWNTRVQGEARTVGASGPARLRFKSVRGMKEAAAVEVMNSWGLSGAVVGQPTDTVGWLAANVGIIVGQPTWSTHAFESCPWQQRECVVTVPADPTQPPISHTAFHLALVEVLETRDLAGTVMSSQVCYTSQHLAGYQSGRALDPRRAIHPCRCEPTGSGDVADDSRNGHHP